MARGYLDESIRPPTNKSNKAALHLYVLAGVIVPVGSLNPTRTAIGAAWTRQRPFHFRLESDTDRLKLLDVIVNVGIGSVVVGGTYLKPSSQERVRARLLVRLATELVKLGITELIAEKRPYTRPNVAPGVAARSGDQRDEDALAKSQRLGGLPGNLTMTFKWPQNEPLLWLPDAVAGSVALHLDPASLDHRFWNRLTGPGVPNLIWP